MNGVNTTVKDVKEVMGTLEEKLQLLTSTANTIESKLQVLILVFYRNNGKVGYGYTGGETKVTDQHS
jgi:hypothetical protein